MNSPINERKLFDAMVREHFHTFVLWACSLLYPGMTVKDNWHIRLICDHFERLRTGDERRLLVCLPPRHLKSIIASVCFPAYMLGRDATAKLVCVSYSQDVADSFAHQTRKLMETAAYKRIFPQTRLERGRTLKRDIGTTRNGHRKATSITGALTGMGGDFLLIDDPIKANDALSEVVRESVNNWYSSTATSRLDNPKTGRMAVIAQRLHVDDLPGRLLQAGGWTSLSLPLIAYEEQVFTIGDKQLTRPPGNILHEAHIGEEEITHLRNTMPSFLFEAQYNQRPVMAGGNIFKMEWLQYDEKIVDPRSCDHIIQSWDTAVQTADRNDYTVCATFGVKGKIFHILDIYRDRIDHPTQIKMVREMRDKWKAKLVIMEGSHGGLAIRQHYQQLEMPCMWMMTINPTGSKNERAEFATKWLEQGRVQIPRHSSWRSSFEQELTAFPKGAFDDQVDAVTQFLGAWEKGPLHQRLQFLSR